MVFNSFAAGKKVYGQGSVAPTRGQVSAQGAQGYLQREIRKPKKLFQGVSTFGNDGQSDTRSGAAATMLANRKSFQGQTKKAPVGSGIVANEPGDGKVDQYGNPIQNNSGNPLPQPNNGGGNGGGGGNGPATPGVPTVEIGPDGTLSLPYSAEWSDTVINALRDMNSQLMDLQFSAQQQAMEFGRANRDADIEYTDVKRGTLGSNATGGTAFSSQYGTAVGENARAYGNYKNDLLMDNNLFNTQTQYEQLAIQNAFNDLIRQDIIQQGLNNPTGPPGGGGGGGGNNGGGGGNNGGGNNNNTPPPNGSPVQDYIDYWSGGGANPQAPWGGNPNPNGWNWNPSPAPVPPKVPDENPNPTERRKKKAQINAAKAYLNRKKN